MNYIKDNFLCRKCGICNQKGVNPYIIGRGNINSKILVLGEANGRTENELKSPFVGASGQLLNYYLKELDIDCFISNAVKGWPKDKQENNRTPTSTEIECCRPFTIELIRKMKPKVIIAIGRIAILQLIKVNHIMELMRGKKYYVPELDTIIVPTYHPAYLLRMHNELYKNNFINDLMFAKNLSQLPSPKKILTEPKSLSDPLDIKKYLLELKNVPVFAFDIETKGLNHRTDKTTDISFCYESGKGVHIKWNDLLEFNDLFKQVLETDNIKIIQNAAFEISFLSQMGYKINGPKFDTMLAYHTLNMSTEGKAGGGGTATDLDTLSWIMTTEGGYKSILSSFGGIAGYQKSEDDEEEEKEEQLEMFDSKKYEVEEKDIISDYDKYLLEHKNYMVNIRKKRLEDLKLTPLQFYSAMDSDVTFRIYKILQPQIETHYSFVFNEIIMPACEVLTKIKLNGIKLDYKYIDKIKNQNEKELEKIKEKFFNKIGFEFNLNSTHELSNFIFNKLKLAPNKKYMTKGGKSKNKKPAVDEAALNFYSEQKPVLKTVVEYRALTKENSTYLDGFKRQADDSTHRIYPDYYQLTATGRASCFLHTVPRNNKIRNIIIPEKGYKLLVGDECIVGETKIVTKNGLVNIENITINTMVRQEDGTYNKVLNLFKQGKKYIYEVETNLGYKIKMTNFHRIRVININGDYVWKSLKEIDIKNDYITIQPFDFSGKEIIDFPKLDFNHRNNIIFEKIPAIINENFCEFLGIMTGNGTITDKEISSLSLCICAKDKDLIFYIKNSLQEFFGKSLHINIRKEYRGAKQIYLHSKPLVKALKNIGMSKKHIPSFLYSSNSKLRASWLRGYFETDGSVGDRISCVSVEESLISEIQLLLLSLGIVSNKRTQKCIIENHKFIAYFLDIKSHWEILFKEKIGFLSKRKKNKLKILTSKKKKNPTYSRHPNLDKKAKKYIIDELKNTRNRGGHVSVEKAKEILIKYPTIYNDLGLIKIDKWGQIYLKIKNIKKIGLQDTYDIEVEKTHSYIANGFISHNSQVELRILAMVSNDTNMINAFASGMDFHSATACTMFNIPKDKFDKKIKEHAAARDNSKSINFGIVYMQSSKALADSLGITEIKAQNFMNRFFASYPKVREWIDETISFVRKNGYVDTVFGRRRYLPKIHSGSEFERGEAERRAVNSIIQGSSADITSIALIRMEKYLTNNNKKSRIVGTVHDSIIIECIENELHDVSKALVECMTKDIPRITIPLKADIDIQDRWNK